MLPIFKALRPPCTRRVSLYLSRSISITCRGSSFDHLQRFLANHTQGKPIDREDIYKYTNGRFLVDEKNQCDRRYVKFDFDRLCKLASSVGESESRIISVDKMEGGFSKALRMTKEDGTEVIAKIPCPNAGPVSSTTASEVAVMKYGKCRPS
jgi:hypothetical protein